MTPSHIFNWLNESADGFAVDAAADSVSHLVDQWYGPGSPLGYEDALAVPKWHSPAFLNPPYQPIRPWLAKCVEQARLGVTVVTILPARTGTNWWKDLVVTPRANICFLTGRIAFLDPDDTNRSQPNHDSAVVIYSPIMDGKVIWKDTPKA